MQTGSLFNKLMSDSNPIVPEVGMGATVLYWSDRHAATIIEVSENEKTVTVQYDTATRSDKNGMSDSQSYTYARNPNGGITVFTLRKNGQYVRRGMNMNGTTLLIGSRHEYYDYTY